MDIGCLFPTFHKCCHSTCTVGSNTSKAVQNIAEHSSLFQSAFALAEALCMAHLQFITKSGDYHAKWCNTLCGFSVIVHKCIAGHIDFLTDCIHNYIQLIPCCLREIRVVIMHFIGHMCDVGSVIANSLKVIDRVQIKGGLARLGGVHLTFGELDQILSKTALIFVDQVFLTLYLVIFILLIIIQKVHSSVYILTKLLGHTIHSTMTLSDCKCRII